MQSQDLMEKTSFCLLRKGYTVKSLTGSCFDVIARKAGRILLIKILSDANSLPEEHARQMKRLSSYMNASPIIVAERAGSGLDDNVVYLRMGIYTLNFKTFSSCIENRLPFVASTNAGLTASIICDKLRQKREETGMSLEQLSGKIGVSRRMITRYEKGDEHGKAQVTIAKAERMYDIFGHEVFDKIDIFNIFDYGKKDGGSKTPIAKKYSELGFEACETRKVPFDIIARKDDELILTEIGDRANPDATLLSRLVDADNLVIFSRKKPKDVPAVTWSEFMDFEKANELIRFLREF